MDHRDFCFVWVYLLALKVKFSADDILQYFSEFSQYIGVHISCKLSALETICMRCQSLFSGKNKRDVINLSSAEFAKTEVKVSPCPAESGYTLPLQTVQIQIS